MGPPLHLSVVAMEKRAFWSPSTTITNFTFYFYFYKSTVSFFSFPLYSHVQVISSAISLVCHLKYPYSYFSTRFCIIIISPVSSDGVSLDSEWQQVYAGLQEFLSIRTDLNKAVVWMVLDFSPDLLFFQFFSMPLGTVLSAFTLIGITVTLMFSG